MPSEKQREASRLNGAASRGPVTPRGKAHSSRNATTHGLTARDVVLSNENPEAYQPIEDRIRTLKLENRAQVIEGDLLKADISGADVVTIYLLTQSNDLLRPHLEKSLRPGARIVSHDYPIRGWNPDVVEKVDAYRRVHYLFLYEVGKK
ncbi:MAG: hypothetical protein FJW39_33755 [Acidobacteria bacterium]|nr:hypothetical protein [Acidobacteriota bacterium]